MTRLLSFVMAARNDNYEGDFVRRMQISLNVLLHLAGTAAGNIEIIIVEWNPPNDRPRLARALVWPSGMPEGLVRIITVPEKVHRRFPTHEKVPLLEWVSKNVGIRYSLGEFVAVMNADIILSEALFSYLASADNLEKGKYYRVNRYDVPDRIPELEPDTIERFCASTWTKVNTSWGTFSKAEYYNLDPAMRMSIYDPEMTMLSQPRRVEEGLGTKVVQRAQEIHSNGSGDFFLMSREDWAQLRGFPELDSITHADGLLTYMAWRFLEQVVLEFPIYHQEHTRRERDGKPVTTWADIYSRVFANAKPNASIVDLTPNGPEWGLRDVNGLESVDVSAFLARWPTKMLTTIRKHLKMHR